MERALDAILPAFDWMEHHQLEVDGTPPAAVEAFLGAPLASGVGVRLLLLLRGLGTDGTVEGLFDRMQFTELHRSQDEVVFGATGTPWRRGGGIGPFGELRSEVVHIAVDVRATVGAAGRTILSTETRVAAVDEAARRSFARYWRLVGPSSGVTRRGWLRAAAARLAVQNDR